MEVKQVIPEEDNLDVAGLVPLAARIKSKRAWQALRDGRGRAGRAPLRPLPKLGRFRLLRRRAHGPARVCHCCRGLAAAAEEEAQARGELIAAAQVCADRTIAGEHSAFKGMAPDHIADWAPHRPSPLPLKERK